MNPISDGIRILEGSADVLVVAPHSPIINGAHENDIRTGLIAEQIHQQLGCTAIINHRFFKPKGEIKKNAGHYFLDLYRVDHAREVPGYIEAIRDVVTRDKKTFVFWIHGIFTHFALARAKEHMDLNLFDGPPEALHALIAFGQGGDPKTGDDKDSFTARKQTAKTFQTRLTRQGMTTLITHPACNNYRGRDAKRFNQWFLLQGFGFDRVESIQMEIKEAGFRDSRQNAMKTAAIIARAIKNLTLEFL
ncbi:MAG: hypothetical protein NDI81_08670 [Desulfobacula sp.]|nr:hypothetical protein [Desulfobacula sp.]